MKLYFLGTNGWFDTNTGSTISTLLITQKQNIIFDAGFGIGKARNLLDYKKPTFVFVSHVHLDHIVGLHTLPMFNFKSLNIISSSYNNKHIRKLIKHPYTASFSDLKYKVNFINVRPGIQYKEPTRFKALKLKHIDKTLGYRLETENKIVTYCSDTAVCKNDLKLAKNADVLIHECAYSHERNDAWGHTGPQTAAKLAKKAKVKNLYLTHFGANSYNKPEKRKEAEKQAKSIFSNTTATTDGLEIEIS